MPKLTRDNFSIAEMSDCSLAERMGIDNTPGFKVLEKLSITVTGLERIRVILGHPIHVNSGYRCEALEKVLCQSDYSTWCSLRGLTIDNDSWKRYFATKDHPKGYAADFTCAQFGSAPEIAKVIQLSSIEFDLCILEGSWVHISFAPKMRREFRIKEFDLFGVSRTQKYNPAALGELDCAPPSFAQDFQDEYRPKSRLGAGH
jgi:putative chitinase